MAGSRRFYLGVFNLLLQFAFKNVTKCFYFVQLVYSRAYSMPKMFGEHI